MVNFCVSCEMYFRLPWKLIYNSCSGCVYILATFHLWWYCLESSTLPIGVSSINIPLVAHIAIFRHAQAVVVFPLVEYI